MKKYLYILLLFPIIITGQTGNFIKSTTYKQASSATIANPTPAQASQNITYFDGLGRPLQKIANAQSPLGKDIIVPIEYDAFGRQVKEYLPYTSSQSNMAVMDNNIVKPALTTQYQTFFNDGNSYSEKEMELSPLSRVLKQSAPGEDWKLGSGHEIRRDYQTNTNADQVRRFGVSFIAGNTENLYLEDQGVYAPNQLYKVTTKDENWKENQSYPTDHTTQEFKDKAGRVVLKRNFEAYMWHDTYYVYDVYGNLTYVLPPKVNTYSNLGQVFQNQQIFLDNYTNGVSLLEDNLYYSEISMNISNGILECYFYGEDFQNENLRGGKIADLDFIPDLPNMNLGSIFMYDSLGYSKFAGNVYIENGDLYFDAEYGQFSSSQGGSYMSQFSINLDNYQTNFTIPSLDRGAFNDLIYQYKYDKRNRLIEKKLPGKEWEYIVYDKLDRPILTQDANLKTTNKWLFTKYDVFNRPVYTGEYTNLIKTTRSEIQLLADVGGTSLSEIKTAANTFNGTTVYYSNNAFPNTTDISLLTINYYDDYNFDLNGGLSATSYGVTPITNAKGMNTGSKIRILGTANWITNIYYYDAKSRPVYTYIKNDYLTSTSTIKNQFDFTGKIVSTTTTHLKNSITTSIVDSFTYDDAGRLLKQIQAINGTSTPEIIVANNYDELGHLTNKKVGGKTSAGLQTVDYTYNIRGWLKTLNDPKDFSQTNSDLFGYGLHYNTISDATYKNIPLFNGNISNTTWKTKNNNTALKQYNYSYDALNRFKTATYYENNSASNKFNESIDMYDRNGNIMYLSRTMSTPGGSSDIDFLRYFYNEGNRLTRVDDNAKNLAYGNEGFKDGTNNDDDYSYDANGNLTLDKNKGITAVVYNHLNLPIKITFVNGTIDYIYDATGVKQRKIVSTGITIDYAGGFQYENNVLKFFTHPEGFVEYNSGVFRYIYQYKDHLGNVRLSYGDSNNDGTIANSEILEENNYYPFGLKHKDNSLANSTQPGLKYKYNGKELQDELGLNVYDYGARNYDPALGRWMNIDPLAEKLYSNTPYNYVTNNPLNFIDPDGRSGIGTLDEKNKTITITSTMYFYGGGANKQQAKDTAENIQKIWNAAGGKIDIDGVSYAVKFAVSGEYVSEKDAEDMAKNNGDNAQNNFVRVEDGSQLDFKSSFYDAPGNSGFYIGSELKNGSTDAHEYGHGLGWYEAGEADGGRHDATIENGIPGIMSPRGTPVSDQYGYGGQPAGQKTMSPYRRGVLASDITKLNIDTNTLKTSGKVSVGTATNNIYNSNGTVKTP